VLALMKSMRSLAVVALKQFSGTQGLRSNHLWLSHDKPFR